MRLRISSEQQQAELNKISLSGIPLTQSIMPSDKIPYREQFAYAGKLRGYSEAEYLNKNGKISMREVSNQQNLNNKQLNTNNQGYREVSPGYNQYRRSLLSPNYQQNFNQNPVILEGSYRHKDLGERNYSNIQRQVDNSLNKSPGINEKYKINPPIPNPASTFIRNVSPGEKIYNQQSTFKQPLNYQPRPHINNIDYLNQNSHNQTLPILLQQLQQRNIQLETKNYQINQLQVQKLEKIKQIERLDSIIKSFYTKGAPVESQLAKQVFDGSYPTLVEQADAMRRQLAEKNKQLLILQDEKYRQEKQLKQYKWRINHYHNRITDLQYKLQEQYNKEDMIKQGRLQHENMELKRVIMQSEGRNRIISEQNNKLKAMVNARNNSIYISPNKYVPPSHPQLIEQQEIRKRNEIDKLQQKLQKLRQQNSELQTEHSRLHNKTKVSGTPYITILDEQERNPEELSYHSKISQQTSPQLQNPKKDGHSTIDKSSTNHNISKSALLDLSMKIEDLKKQNDSLKELLYS